MSYSVQNIRNVCLLGHSGSGKTALAESLIYITGAIDRMGRVADGNMIPKRSSVRFRSPPPLRRWSTRAAGSMFWIPRVLLIFPVK